jgi:hypothetical protein
MLTLFVTFILLFENLNCDYPVFNFQTSSRARHADYKFLIEIRLGCQEPGQPAGKIKIT